MPELPEVETIKNDLLPLISGQIIKAVEIYWPGTLRNASVETFSGEVVGRTITCSKRRGKYLIFPMDNGKSIAVHLKMSGSLIFIKKGESLPASHVRAMFVFDDGSRLAFRDIRKFGGIWLLEKNSGFLDKLGPEPLENNFTPQIFQNILKGRDIPIKALLLDQVAIAGIGNMYADEALFEAGIKPGEKAGGLREDEAGKLYSAILNVLKKGIKSGGASVSTYQRPDGSKGLSHRDFRVARRRDQQCLECKTPLEYTKVRGRGTIYCPHCQK
ncbi:MAG: bifunctional DNA-formamidopyrimidine glycosylase/DNA-(apurinic or apyrimidinic site) lyase [Dehalococcoidia bacterium]|nr:bifunctional DNA-formamidopyrimidine glycosylase/DNA-(apurinic or apyrimidinic site) lyase [Dehalococcoidia bacterium]